MPFPPMGRERYKWDTAFLWEKQEPDEGIVNWKCVIHSDVQACVLLTGRVDSISCPRQRVWA